jgi:hypothetical protein
MTEEQALALRNEDTQKDRSLWLPYKSTNTTTESTQQRL